MIINSITLDNFRSHKHSVINLNEGISVILGENGAGKSSIFEAISYSFFKTFTGKIEDLFRKSADENDNINEMKVTVEFEHGITHYKLVRGKKKSSNIAKLYRKESDNLSLICEGDTVVTREIESILSLDSKSFLNAVYIRQGEITDLIEKTAAEKKELIAKLLNMDSLQKASDDFKEIIKRYEEQISKNEGTLLTKDAVEESIEQLNDKIEENNEELEKIDPNIKEIEDELKNLEIKKLQSEKDKNEYDNLKNQIEQQNKLVDSIKSNKTINEGKIKDVEECELKSLELEKYVKQLPKLQELKEYKTELDKHNLEKRNLENNIKKINENKDIQEKSKENYDKYEKIKNENSSLENEKQTLENEVNKNKEVKLRLKTLKERNEGHVAYIRETSGYAAKIFGENFSSPEQIESKVKEESEKVNGNIEKITEDINNNKNKLSVVKNDLNNTEKSLKELKNTQDTCPICQSPISHEKHLELSKDYEEKISTFRENISELDKKNKKHEDEREECGKYLEKIDNINIIKLNDEYTEFNEILKNIKDCEKLLPEIEKKEEAYEKLKKEIDENKDLLNDLEKYHNDFMISSEILKGLPDKEDEEKKLDVTNSKILEIKGKCTEIIRQYRVTDNLDHLIKYAQQQVELYNKYLGIIAGKDSLLKENENLINNLSEEEQCLMKFEEEINNLKYDEEKYKTILESYKLQDEKLEKSKLRKNTIETEIKSDEKQLENKNEELKRLNDLSEEQDNLKKYVEILEYIRKLYGKDGVQKELRENARPDIEKHTLDIFNEFDFEYTSLELDENYDVYIENKNERLTLNMMSGGEKIVIALALRLGIASTVSGNRTDMLLLDEPTIHLDAERRRLLIDIIRQIKIVPQMIVVSHDDEMESISNNIIKIAKKNGISYVDDS